jgi:hypothetical protein
VKPTAWTDEDREERAKQAERDYADAYERGLDGKPIVVRHCDVRDCRHASYPHAHLVPTPPVFR